MSDCRLTSFGSILRTNRLWLSSHGTEHGPKGIIWLSALLTHCLIS